MERESVWNYPRPPRLEPTTRQIRVLFNGAVIAETQRAYRVLETSHPPVYYIPREDVDPAKIELGEGSSFCEWKGSAIYFDVISGSLRARAAAWSYPDPVAAFLPIRDALAFYAGLMDECTVDGERVVPQPGGFYGGWITSELDGPFKGAPGTAGW